MSIQRWSPVPATALALALSLGFSACTEATTTPEAPDPALQAIQSEAAQAQKDLAALRALTTHFRTPEEAVLGGWDVPVTDCKADPVRGGMGYHYASFPFYLDGVADPTEPEILLFAPARDGTLRLAAVEYIVAGADSPDRENPPRLFGRDMDWSDEFSEWQLHVWIWKHNPTGLFSPWNPTVSCEGWEDVPAPM